MLYFFINRDHYSPKIYEDEEQVLELFESNFEDFEKFMNIIYHHKAFGEIFKKRSESHTPNYKEVKKYMSKEEYEVVETFWVTYKPYYMGSSWIEFLVNKEPFAIDLFSCRGMSDSQRESYLSSRSQQGDIKQINNEGDWYCLIYNKN